MSSLFEIQVSLKNSIFRMVSTANRFGGLVVVSFLVLAARSAAADTTDVMNCPFEDKVDFCKDVLDRGDCFSGSDGKPNVHHIAIIAENYCAKTCLCDAVMPWSKCK